MDDFLAVFIPLFVAIDAIGIFPLFLSLTEGLTPAKRKQLVTESTLVALVISVVFIFTGKLIFNFLGITTSDFRVAGGIVLLILAIMNLLFNQQESRRDPQDTIGVVPIGIPLIMGPAALTTILILVKSHGYALTIASLLLNLGIAWFVFTYSTYILKIIGKSGARAMAKVAALFLAAIAVMMIRVGISEYFG